MVLQTASILETFRRQSDKVHDANLKSAEQLNRAAADVPDRVQQAMAGTLSGMASEATQRLRHGLQAPLAELQQQINATSQRIDPAAQRLTASAAQVDQLLRRVTWVCVLAVGVLVTGLTLAGVAAWKANSAIKKTQLEADVLRAYNEANVRLCDGRLCAKPAPGNKRFGDKGEYILVAPRE